MNSRLKSARPIYSQWGLATLAGVLALGLAFGGTQSTGAATPITETGGPPTTRVGVEQGSSPAGQVGQGDNHAGNGSQDAPLGGQQFQDVPPSNTFYDFINRLSVDSVISGYACGGPGEPCVAPDNLPYYRPGNNVPRQQMAKFVDQARHIAQIDIFTNETNDYFALRAWNDRVGGKGLFGVTEQSGSGEDYAGINAASYAYSAGATNSTGLYAFAASRAGARIYTQDPSSVYGLLVEAGGIKVGNADAATNEVFVLGPLTVTGAKTGYVVDIMLNVGTTDLQAGDVVALGGEDASAPQLGDIPVPNVVAASEAYNTGVVGVVDMKWIPADPSAPSDSKANTGYYDAQATTIKPGEYMGVVTLGSYKGVRVDATGAPIRVGDLLVSSANSGFAMKATDKTSSIGAVIGKALASLDSGTGTIPVLVTLK